MAGIASQSIASLAVGRAQIATAGSGDDVYSYNYPAGSYTWTCPATGWYRFVLWGAGGGANNGVTTGGSGALYIAERFVTKGQTVALVIGACSSANANGAASTATFPDAEIITAGGGQKDTTAGAATANRAVDIVLQGSAGALTGGTAGTAGLGDAGGVAGAGSGGSSGGAGAPGYGPHRGGDGQNGALARSAESPGAGGAENGASGNAGGDGLGIVYRIRLRA